jgi:peptidoglycan-associated lipoprotein
MKLPSTAAAPLGALVLIAACLAGCATEPPPPPPPRTTTTVVLLPDEDSQTGALSVTTTAGTQQVDQAYSATTVDTASSLPSPPKAIGREAVEQTWGTLMKAQASKPVTFVLNFVLNKSALTDESKALIPALLKAARDRKPTEILVFGHADASGSSELNLRLSAERARMVADLLRASDPTLEQIDVRFFGASSPLNPAQPLAPENRRAEVMIL